MNFPQRRFKLISFRDRSSSAMKYNKSKPGYYQQFSIPLIKFSHSLIFWIVFPFTSTPTSALSTPSLSHYLQHMYHLISVLALFLYHSIAVHISKIFSATLLRLPFAKSCCPTTNGRFNSRQTNRTNRSHYKPLPLSRAAPQLLPAALAHSFCVA